MLKAKFNSDVGRVVANRKKQTALRNKIALSGGSPYANYNSDALMASVKGLGNIYDSLDDDNIEDVILSISSQIASWPKPYQTFPVGLCHELTSSSKRAQCLLVLEVVNSHALDMFYIFTQRTPRPQDMAEAHQMQVKSQR